MMIPQTIRIVRVTDKAAMSAETRLERASRHVLYGHHWWVRLEILAATRARIHLAGSMHERNSDPVLRLKGRSHLDVVNDNKFLLGRQEWRPVNASPLAWVEREF